MKLYTAAELSEIVAKWPEGHFEDEDGNTVPGPVQAPTAAAPAAKASPPATLSATAPRPAPSAFRRPAIIESMEQPGATMPRTVPAPAASLKSDPLAYADTFLKAKRGDPDARAELARMTAAAAPKPQADTRDPVAFADDYFKTKRSTGAATRTRT